MILELTVKEAGVILDAIESPTGPPHVQEIKLGLIVKLTQLLDAGHPPFGVEAQIKDHEERLQRLEKMHRGKPERPWQ